MNHPSYETLIDYVEGRLPGIDRTQTENHLSSPCQQCSNQIAQLRTVLEAMAADRTTSPSSDTLNRAIALYRDRSGVTSRSPLRVLAELLFDSRLQLSPAATRGAAHTRQMLFATPKVDIDLSITAEHKEHNLAGQILDREQADEPVSAFVILQDEAGTLVRDVQIDSLGQFIFKHVPSGVYELVADLGSQEIAITGLDLGNKND
jgi:hypothetical protein